MKSPNPQGIPLPPSAPRQFKEWTKPGPLIDSLNESTPGETLDAISGSYRLYQYRDGHRFSTDDVLVAWYATSHGIRAERVLDLGSGIGSVAMIAAWRLPFAQFTTVEAQSMSIELAKKSRRFNHLDDRLEIREGDFRESGVIAAQEKFDIIMGSPPYFPLTDGVLSDHPQKVACRFEMRGSVTDYCATAAKHLDHGGMLFFIFPTEQAGRTVQAARDAELTILRSRPVIFKEGEPPLLTLYQFIKSAHIPPAFRLALPESGVSEPALTIRNRDGKVSQEYQVAKLSIGFPP